MIDQFLERGYLAGFGARAKKAVTTPKAHGIPKSFLSPKAS